MTDVSLHCLFPSPNGKNSVYIVLFSSSRVLFLIHGGFYIWVSSVFMLGKAGQIVHLAL